jgi:hypothetical protein
MLSAISWKLLLKAQAEFCRVATRFEKTARITWPSSPSLPLSYGCGKCPHHLGLFQRRQVYSLARSAEHHQKSSMRRSAAPAWDLV